MVVEEIFSMVAELKKKLFYIIVVFGAGAIISFSYMGDVINKIKTDMFWRLNIPDRPDASGHLIEISNNLTLMSRQLGENYSLIAGNLSNVSGELINISHSLNLNKPGIIYLTPMEVLMLEFKMSLIFGFLIAFPLILYYAYRGVKGKISGITFIHQNRYLIVVTILASIILFLIGAGYSYYYMLPFFLTFIYQDAYNLGINANFSVYEFISFIVMTTVILGVAFELPVILTFLVHLGVITRKMLNNYRKHAYILLLIIAAWVTPDPTMFTQIMVALPFIVLYEASLIVMRLTGK
ncbi:MAG: twin-arginine translocase subunit TatC [Candidatus Methanoperedens sp.]|nr:twin-arginine translocase subunit TatC [Candidatus Methanoperedens sp.]